MFVLGTGNVIEDESRNSPCVASSWSVMYFKLTIVLKVLGWCLSSNLDARKNKSPSNIPLSSTNTFAFKSFNCLYN